MKPNPDFQNMPKFFWAAVRTLSQKCGYTVRGTGTVRVPSLHEMESAYTKLGLSPESLKTAVINGKTVAERLSAYFTYRADTLNTIAKLQLMDATEAKQLFEKLRKKLKPTCPIPMNKQKGKMKAPAYLTAIINWVFR